MSKRTKTIIAVFAVLIIAAAGAGGGYHLYQQSQEAKIADPVTAEKEYQDLQSTILETASDPMNTYVNFDELKAINSDVYAWISIPGTNVEYPILQSVIEPDEYYLNTTIDRKTGLPGTIYTEKYHSQEFTDPVTLIYGHTLVDGTMFSQLHSYTDRAFFDSNPYIYIYLPDRTLKYQIFAAVAFDDRYLMEYYNFMLEEDFNNYIGELKACMTGHINEEVPVAYGDYVITLSTCIDEFPDQRWLVNAVLLPEEEAK